MEWTDEYKAFLIETANKFKGSDRRRFMAQVIKPLGYGGPRRAELQLGWNRRTIRKGIQELESGITCIDNFSARGCKSAEEHLPNLLVDIKNIVDSQSQTDPSFRTKRLYRRISAPEIRRQLIVQKRYTDQQLPTVRTIENKLNKLGYHPSRVAKSKPKKRFHKPMPSS